MRYVVDVTQQQEDVIKELIYNGRYQNVAQFISTAIENQIHIETSDAVYVTNRVDEKNIRSDSMSTSFLAYPHLIKLTKIKNLPQTVTIPKFSDLAISLQGIKEEQCWLWGQTNKILPIKIGLRILYSLIGNNQWLDLEEYRNKASDIAAGFGTNLRKYEDAKGKLRDGRLSTGMPDEKEFKSKLRYKGQFLAYIRKDGKFDGAMPFLRFVNLNKDEKGRIFIGLTEPGLDFAKLDNPAIDYDNYEDSFSIEEINFYLDHVSRYVRGEKEAIMWLLNKVSQGFNNIESINDELSKELSVAWKEPSSAVINTQRAGLMSRVFEIGLIEKEKRGVSVTYAVSQRGGKFLNKA